MKMFLSHDEFKASAVLLGTFYQQVEGLHDSEIVTDLLNMSPQELCVAYPDRFTSVTEEGVHFEMPEAEYIAGSKICLKHSGALARIVNAVKTLFQLPRVSYAAFKQDMRKAMGVEDLMNVRFVGQQSGESEIASFLSSNSSKYYGLDPMLEIQIEESRRRVLAQIGDSSKRLKPVSCKVTRRTGFGLMLLIEVTLKRGGRGTSAKLLYIYDWPSRKFIEIVGEVKVASKREVIEAAHVLLADLQTTLAAFDGPVISYWLLNKKKYYTSKIPDSLHDDVLAAFKRLPFEVDLDGCSLGVNDDGGVLTVGLTILFVRRHADRIERPRLCYIFDLDTKAILYKDRFAKGVDPDGFIAAAHLLVKQELGLVYDESRG